MTSVASNISFQIRQKITTAMGAGQTINITNDLERDQTIETLYGASVVVRDKLDKNRERMIVNIDSGVMTIMKRGLDQTDSETEVSALKKEWNVGTEAYVTQLAFDVLDVSNTGYGISITPNISFYGDNNTYGTWNHYNQNRFYGYGVGVGSLTTTEMEESRNAFEGNIIYNETVGLFYGYGNSGLLPFDTGVVTPNASESTAGKTEQSTLAEQGTQTELGGTGAPLFLNPKNTTKTGGNASDENKIPLLNSDGKVASTMLGANRLFGGDGSDGALNISSGTTNISFTNDVVVKNYSSISISGTAIFNFTGVSGAGGAIAYIKVSGDFTMSAGSINADGQGGGGGGGGGFSSNGSPGGTGMGIDGNAVIGNYGNTKGGGGGSDSSGTTGGSPGAGASRQTFWLTVAGKTIRATTGGGGGGGAGGNGSSGASGGGNGGRGGGIIIFEVAGNINFSGGTISVNGSNGNNGGGGNFNDSGGGGGGGGAGGTVLFIYDGTLISSAGTLEVDGGNGGNGGTGGHSDNDNDGGGGGGGGGANESNSGSGGAGGDDYDAGSNGSGGAAGTYGSGGTGGTGGSVPEGRGGGGGGGGGGSGVYGYLPNTDFY